MLILSDAVKKASNGAHIRRSLALTNAGSQGLAIDGPWRSQMWVSMRLPVNLPDRTCFEPSPHPSAVRLSIHSRFFKLHFLKGQYHENFQDIYIHARHFIFFREFVEAGQQAGEASTRAGVAGQQEGEAEQRAEKAR